MTKVFVKQLASPGSANYLKELPIMTDCDGLADPGGGLLGCFPLGLVSSASSETSSALSFSAKGQSYLKRELDIKFTNKSEIGQRIGKKCPKKRAYLEAFFDTSSKGFICPFLNKYFASYALNKQKVIFSCIHNISKVQYYLDSCLNLSSRPS